MTQEQIEKAKMAVETARCKAMEAASALYADDQSVFEVSAREAINYLEAAISAATH